MSKYTGMQQKELVSTLIKKDIEIDNLTKKNHELEAAQNEFMAELDEEFEAMESMNGWQRFIKGFSIAWQIMNTYLEAKERHFNQK